MSKQHCEHRNARPLGGSGAIKEHQRYLWCPRCGAIGKQDYPNPYKGAGFYTREWEIPELCRGKQ